MTNKTIDCQCGHKRYEHIDKLYLCQMCDCDRFKLAEPHVVQTPQESSPGFEAVLNSTAIVYMESKGIEIVEAMHQLHPNFTEPILAAHQKEIQAAKRETLQKLTEAYIGRTFNAKTDWHLEFERLVGILAAELKHLEEETTT